MHTASRSSVTESHLSLSNGIIFFVHYLSFSMRLVLGDFSRCALEPSTTVGAAAGSTIANTSDGVTTSCWPITSSGWYTAADWPTLWLGICSPGGSFCNVPLDTVNTAKQRTTVTVPMNDWRNKGTILIHCILSTDSRRGQAAKCKE